jgi:hypothetical protein
MLCAIDGLHMHRLSLANGGKGWKRIGNFLDIGGIEQVWFEDERLCGQPWDNLMIRLTTCLLAFHERDDLCKD